MFSSKFVINHKTFIMFMLFEYKFKLPSHVVTFALRTSCPRKTAGQLIVCYRHILTKVIRRWKDASRKYSVINLLLLWPDAASSDRVILQKASLGFWSFLREPIYQHPFFWCFSYESNNKINPYYNL